MIALFAAVASAQDDGSYRPEHHGGEYSGNDGRYRQVATPVFRVQPLVQPVVRYQPIQPAYQPLIQPAYQPLVQQAYQPLAQQFIPATRYQSLGSEGHWGTLRDIRSQSPNGDYSYEFETENGIQQQQTSQVVPPNSQRVTGHYTVPGPNGEQLRVDYVADENGYRATGAHLPGDFFDWTYIRFVTKHFHILNIFFSLFQFRHQSQKQLPVHLNTT